jgi:hypothetical protein
MNPLVVTGSTCSLSDIGRRNIENLKRLGVDYLEVTLNKVTYSQVNGKVVFALSMTYQGVNFGLSVGNVQNLTVVEAAIPYNASGGLYNLTLTINGAAATPAPTSVGFVSVAEMMAYYSAGAVWGSYGVWGWGEDFIVLYADNAVVQSGVITVTIS